MLPPEIASHLPVPTVPYDEMQIPGGAIRPHYRAFADWKLAVNRRREVYLLYDLRADRFETRNLAAVPGHEGPGRGLRRHLDKTLQATG